MQSIHSDNGQCWGNVWAPSCLLLPPIPPPILCVCPFLYTYVVSILGLPENVVWAVLSSKHVSTLHLWLQHLCAHSAVNMCHFVWLCGSFFSCAIKNLLHPHKLHWGLVPYLRINVGFNLGLHCQLSLQDLFDGHVAVGAGCALHLPIALLLDPLPLLLHRCWQTGWQSERKPLRPCCGQRNQNVSREENVNVTRCDPPQGKEVGNLTESLLYRC